MIKGKNNDAADKNPVLAKNIVGLYSGVTISYVGDVISFAQSKHGNIVFLMFGYGGFTIWQALREPEDKDKKIAHVR